ncbi:Protein disulfide isomerase [Spironucleus salmonicida]|uniref:protein disulfide-isomerase n=1 Tax=Spironucleus salmonicida TaxID=348837 RepID=V6LE32_9EUKA|nr:Protein disulfide isomerase [Spironucleus salmonicida]|eukprot:EST42538.1 Protein disulfide isomerase [Spironucleus salmonicida]
MLTILTLVSSLTPENFTQATAAPSLIKFYAPWCGHCKQLAPEYEKLSNLDLPFGVFEVDCSQFQSLCEVNKIAGFPAVMFIFNGNSHLYDGDRQAQKIVSWTEKMSRPVLSESSQINKSGVFFTVSTPNLEADEHIFAFAKGKYEIEAVKSEERAIICHSNGTEISSGFEGAKTFVSRNAFGAFPELTTENFDALIGSNLKILIISVEEIENFDKQAYLQIANQIQNSIPCWLNATTFRSFASNFNAQNGGKAIIIDYSESEKFYVSDIASPAQFLQFLRDVEAGKIEQFVVSNDSSNFVKYANYILLTIAICVVGSGVAFAWRCFSQKPEFEPELRTIAPAENSTPK